MPEPLPAALDALRPLLLDPDGLVRAVAAGRRRAQSPPYRKVELRPVDLKAGRHLQVVTYDERTASTRNVAYPDAPAEVDALLDLPFGNWHVQTTGETRQLRVTRKGQAQVHTGGPTAEQRTGHDRARPHLIDPGDPLFTVLGAGADKRRQVDAFLRVLAGAVDEAALPADRPWRVVDLGCGNAYLTFAAYRLLSATGHPVELVGVDLRPGSRERNTAIAAELGWAGQVRFVEGSILDAPVAGADVVLALHACDTATDDALAQAIRWSATLVLAAPCCHHDVQRQLREHPGPSPYRLLTRHGILRERFGDVLTDALRAALVRRSGYRVDVVEFVASKHTPRNTLLKAVRTGAAPDPAVVAEYDELVAAWGVHPHLQTLLADAG